MTDASQPPHEPHEPEQPKVNPMDLETDPRFPTGRWRGFYKQPNLPGDMELDLTFAGGLVEGAGRDPVGHFTFRGTYDTTNGLCTMVKAYPTHRVNYRGYNEGQGIFGQWNLVGPFSGVAQHGGFFLWPIDGLGHHERQEAHADAPVEAERVLVPTRRR